jgi:hypothetical protein
MIQIAIVNACTVLTDAQIEQAVAALQIQVSRDFAPAWGVDAQLSFVPKGQPLPLGVSQIIIADDSDSADYLGFHDLTADGKPEGHVFAGSDLKAGASWTVTLSHEALEMLADPAINLIAEIDNADGTSLFIAYEICDPVEQDGAGYDINGVRVSDFVLPSYFEAFHKDGTRYDFCGLLHDPAPAMLPDGYLSILDPQRGWQQRNAEHVAGRSVAVQRPRVGSRRERRRTPRSQWIRSQPKGNV